MEKIGLLFIPSSGHTGYLSVFNFGTTFSLQKQPFRSRKQTEGDKFREKDFFVFPSTGVDFSRNRGCANSDHKFYDSDNCDGAAAAAV